ncbi:MAG: PA14 domain-containing protein, partial [Anaerolineae bacterium]
MMKQWLWFLGGVGAALLVAGLLILGPLQPLRGRIVRGGPAVPTVTDTPEKRPTQTRTPETDGPVSLDWQREGGVAGFCDRLSIDEENRVYYAICGGTVLSSDLMPDERATYRAYTERYASFEYEAQDNPGGADNMTVRLSFVGRGRTIPTDTEQSQIAAWAEALYERLGVGGASPADVVLDARLHLATRLGRSLDNVYEVSVESVIWPNTCLGIESEGTSCAEVETPGYRIILEVAGREYEYRADQRGTVGAVEGAGKAVNTPTPPPAPSPSATTGLPTPYPTPTYGPPTATPTVTATPTQVVLPSAYWRGEYYGNPILSGAPALVRNDAAIQFDWGGAAPATGVPHDHFSVRWVRRLHFDEGAYRFNAHVDDGVRLWVDGRLLIDAWHSGVARTLSAYVWLGAGPHDVRVEYYEEAGVAVARVWWERLEAFSAWKGEYYANRELIGPPAFVRDDAQIAFDWGSGSPGPGVPRDDFSVCWTRNVTLQGGKYRFWARADDGVRLRINSFTVIDEWREASGAVYRRDVELNPGTYTITVEYYERGGNARIGVGWDLLAAHTPTPTRTRTPVPPTA